MPATNASPARDRWRAYAVVAVGWLFVAVGGFVAVRAVAKLREQVPLAELVPMLLSGAVAIAGGALVLRGRSAGRWILAVWMVFHLVLSALHSQMQLALHVGLFLPIGWLLFAPQRRPAPRRSGS